MYTVQIPRRVQKEIRRLGPMAGRRILAAIQELATDPRPLGSEPLEGRPGWRRRVGDYRILYDIDDATRTITIIEVGHRRDVYRR